ncbi:unnamed protein product [Rotaria sordida]|uniref:F-box domain-containing protein n=1 Tax=Rotaria sordida TaxID=392033 RepID=A0A815VNK8_9BILA|nr:unnamed protein product [Rotaria sordida]CAF1532724.1 unnamed protein product [Rotaria sordida]
MISTFETLPNEILLNIFCYLSWDKILISLWSLNRRINSIIYSIFSIDKNGLIFNQPDLSYKKFSSILQPLILNSSYLSSSIKYIHFDGTYSNSYNVINQCLYYNNDKQILCFPNLKSLKITRCLLSRSLIQTLSLLIQYQLEQFTLTFDEDIVKLFVNSNEICRNVPHTRKSIIMFKKLICQLFSDKCQLISLQLDIADDNNPLNIHQCFTLCSHPSSSSISNKIQYCCLTLRYLYVRLQYTSFLEHLIEHIPNIERLSVIFKNRMNLESRSRSDIETLIKSNGNWFEKVPKLNYFTLKVFVRNDFEFAYLKWILNNLNHIEKFKLHLQIHKMYSNKMVKEYVVDANFIHHFDPNIFTWPYITSISIDLHPFLYLFLEQFDKLFPNVSYIKVYAEYYRNIGQFELPESLTIPFEKGQCKVTDIQFRNVTRLDLGFCLPGMINSCDTSIELNKARAKVFAHLISMSVQLKYLLVENIEWLFHVIQYASNELKRNALNTIQCAEFGIPSCHYGSNDSIYIGKNLVPFLSTYMPQLQTLYLWRPDDFPWTSIRPDITPGYFHHIDVSRWIESLETSESIAKHVNVFKKDLRRLTRKLKQFVFLDIHGRIDPEKIEPYRSMVKKCFRRSKVDVKLTRFRLWI